MSILTIPHIDECALDSDYNAGSWAKAEWQDLTFSFGQRSNYRSRFKICYSDDALFLVFDSEDKKLSCSNLKDFDDLYEEDVVEVFIQTDRNEPLYFEYEISPLGAELPLMVHNNGEEFMGWLPWKYEDERRCQVHTQVHGGPAEPGATVSSWTAATRIPFALFKGLGQSTPKAGTVWYANFYRIDYDVDPATHWTWSPLPNTSGTFHQMDGFGQLHFS